MNKHKISYDRKLAKQGLGPRRSQGAIRTADVPADQSRSEHSRQGHTQ